MSWKGVTKAISRLPHQLTARKGESTVDQDFTRLETRFNEIVKQIGELQKHASAFRDAIASMLEHQMLGAATLEEIYDPTMGVQPSEDGVTKRRRPGEVSAAAIQAVQDYAMAMRYCRDEILQELDKLDRSVIQPADHLTTIIKSIQKTITKRQHKLIDYDRYRLSLQKFKNMADRSPSEDKHVYKLESQLATATEDYEYLNDMLKQDLVRFLRLANSFIQPVQDSFYNIQCKLIAGMYARIYEVVDNHRHYFVTLDQPLEDGYRWRMNQRNVQQELENLNILKKGGAANGLIRPAQMSLQERAAARHQAEEQSQQKSPQHYSGAAAAKRPPPPPPPPKPRQNNKQYVIALYDLEAQQEGDLDIRKNDRIEVLERTNDTMDWWKGRIGDRVGMFPANYVQEL